MRICNWLRRQTQREEFFVKNGFSMNLLVHVQDSSEERARATLKEKLLSGTLDDQLFSGFLDFRYHPDLKDINEDCLDRQLGTSKRVFRISELARIVPLNFVRII